jgi:uncharacterized damage-inducible protein DinB
MKSCRLLAIAFAVLFAVAANAQDAAPSLSDGIKQGYNNIKNNFTKAAEAMPEDGYDFAPTKEERTFGGWVAHIADAQMAICSRANGAQKSINAGSMTKKSDLTAALQQSFDECDKAYNALTDATAKDSVQSFRGPTSRLAALAGNVAHDNEAYGSMAVYLRLKGIVPPSSEGRGGPGGARPAPSSSGPGAATPPSGTNK